MPAAWFSCSLWKSNSLWNELAICQQIHLEKIAKRIPTFFKKCFFLICNSKPVENKELFWIPFNDADSPDVNFLDTIVLCRVKGNLDYDKT